MRRIRILNLPGVLSLLIILGLNGCSGGGGGSAAPPSGGGSSTLSVSGVAAAGTPIIGYVYLKDSAQHTLGPNEIASDGSYSFDVTKLTPTFFLRAIGSVGGINFDLISAGMGAGTININPLTHLAVASAANVSDPANAYANPAQYPITSANLDKAIADIQKMLKPLLDASGANINPINGSYTANHRGLDGVFDLVKVEIDSNSGSVTVRDKATNQIIAAAAVNNLSNPTQTLAVGNVPSAQTLTDLEAIAARLTEFANVINGKGVNLAFADLDPFFAENYSINDGMNRAQQINNFVWGLQGAIITRIANLAFIEKIGNDYRVLFNTYFVDGSFTTFYPSYEGAIFTYENGLWKFRGNGFKLSFGNVGETGTLVHQWIKVDGTSMAVSGLNFVLQDVGNYGLQKAVITGPGLPKDGLTLSKPAGEPVNLYIEPGSPNIFDPIIPTKTFYTRDDATIETMPNNAEYAVSIFAQNNQLIESRKVTLSRRPFLSSELTANFFPSIMPAYGMGVAPSHNISTANIGGTASFSYSKPTAYQPAYLRADLNFGDDLGHFANYGVNLALNQTSASITSAPPPWTPTNAELQIQALDIFQRSIRSSWMYQ